MAHKCVIHDLISLLQLNLARQQVNLCNRAFLQCFAWLNCTRAGCNARSHVRWDKITTLHKSADHHIWVKVCRKWWRQSKNYLVKYQSTVLTCSFRRSCMAWIWAFFISWDASNFSDSFFSVSLAKESLSSWAFWLASWIRSFSLAICCNFEASCDYRNRNMTYTCYIKTQW